MGTRGQIKLKAIWKMLRKCAPGHTKDEKTHHWIVRHESRHGFLPTGAHGAKDNAEIEIGNVKNLVNSLELEEKCVKKLLPQLR